MFQRLRHDGLAPRKTANLSATAATLAYLAGVFICLALINYAAGRLVVELATYGESVRWLRSGERAASVSGSVVLGESDVLGAMISGIYAKSSGIDTHLGVSSPAPGAAIQLGASERSGLTTVPAKAGNPLAAILGGMGVLEDQPGAMPPPVPVLTYRTVCVRLCDGSFFPISFATTPDRFGRDEEVCQNGCSSPARLYVYQNPGAEPDAMEDTEGRPYSRLSTAFKFRTAYDSSCTCRPQPWSQEATDRHRMYALAAAAKTGDKKAASELKILTAAIVESERAEAKAARPKNGTASRKAGKNESTASLPPARQRRAAPLASQARMVLGGNVAKAPSVDTARKAAVRVPTADDEFRRNLAALR